MVYQISDKDLDDYYAKDYYGTGTNYFEPYEEEDEYGIYGDDY